MRPFQIDKDRPIAYLQITTDTAATATTTKVTNYNPIPGHLEFQSSNPTSENVEVKNIIQLPNT